MRIGIDCRLPAYQMGGISQYTLFLIQALAALPAASAHEFIIFHSRKDTRDHTPAAANFRRATLWTPCHHRLERQALMLELARFGLDVLHSPDFIPPAGGAKRRIITVHDLNFWLYPEFLTDESRRYYLDQIDWAVAQASWVAADSEHTRQDLLKQLGTRPAKVRTIPLAANPLYAEPVASTTIATTLEKFGLPASFLLFVGTLEPRKNVPFLLQVYATLRKQHGVTQPLVLVGRKGWLYDDIFATIEALELGPYVIHLAGVDNQALAALYHAATLLALPSHYEGFGLPPLEAMHCGCPVVVSDRASLREVVGPAGFRLEPDDHDGWVEACWTLIQDRDQRETLIAAGKKQAARFNWAATAAATFNLYTNAAPD